MRVLVAGALGEVGRAVSTALESRGHDVVRVSARAGMAVSLEEGAALVRDRSVDAVLNCAGRGDRRATERSGRDATEVLAGAIRESGLPAVLLSTTRVLEGYTSDYAEGAQALPKTEYAEANAANEAAWLAEAGPTAHVLRITNFFAQPSSVDSPQALLLPWSLVTDALTTGHIGIRSGASLAKEFVSADDVASTAERLFIAVNAPPTVATVPGATFTLADLAHACERALASVGREKPTVAFGPDGPAGPVCLPGWLASHGWHGSLTLDEVTGDIAGWLRRPAR